MRLVGEESTSSGSGALDTMLSLLHRDLRALADRYMRRERPDHTLQRTALVHEAYLRLRDRDDTTWQSAAHVIGAAANTMRQVLVDHARGRGSRKRRVVGERVPVDELFAKGGPDRLDVIVLDEALRALHEEAPRAVRVVEMRFFGGLTIPEVADVLTCTERTIERDWRFAQAWLRRALADDGEPDA